MSRKHGPEQYMYTDGICIPSDDSLKGPAWGWIIVSLFTIPVITPFLLISRVSKALRRRKLGVYRTYAAIIGDSPSISTAQLAAISGRPEANVLIDLRDMIERGYLGRDAFLDRRTNTLHLAASAREKARRDSSTETVAGPETVFDKSRKASDRRWKADVREYRAIIGDRLSIALSEIAETTGKPLMIVRGEIQRMLDEDLLGAKAFIDHRHDILHMQGGRTKAETPKAQAKAPETKKADGTFDTVEFERILQKIHTLNEQIEDVSVSEKIDRIGMQTASIFSVIQLRPERSKDVEKVLGYYLPTTFKLLEMYDMMEEEPRKTAEIRESMKRIETSLDLLIRAYDKIRENMFRSETLDVDTDIDVLNAMLIKDGLFAPRGTDLNEVRTMGGE